MRGAARFGVIALGFCLPCAVVYGSLKVAWPLQHDLSDIGTGLLRDALALASGVVGLLLTVLFLRLARRR